MGKIEAFSVPIFSETALYERPVTVTLGGRYTKLENHAILKRTIDEYILILCIDGEGWVETYGQCRHVSPGQMFFLPSEVAHRYGSVSGGYWSLLWFHCTGKGVSYFFHQIYGNKPGPIQPFTIKINERFTFERALTTLENVKNPIDILSAEAILTELFCQVSGTYKKISRDSSGKHAIEEAIRLMEETEVYSISLDELSQRAGLSKYYFIKLFKQHTQFTPMEYFNRIKLKRSCVLLADASLPINAVSEALGYSNPYHFSKAFKQLYGISPSEFRNKLSF